MFCAAGAIWWRGRTRTARRCAIRPERAMPSISRRARSSGSTATPRRGGPRPDSCGAVAVFCRGLRGVQDTEKK